MFIRWLLWKMVGRQYTSQERAFMVKTYIRTQNVSQTKRLFNRRFHRNPSRNTILRNANKYQNEGTSKNLNKGRSGRRRTGRSQHNINLVRRAINRNGQISARRNTVGLPSATFNRITRLDLHYRPYRVHTQQALQHGDPARRLAYCRWLINHQPRFMVDVIIGDEACFHMDGHVNTWNTRHYGPVNPNVTYDIPHNKQKIITWIGIVGDNTILRPYLFPNNVNGQAYLNMINNFVVPLRMAKYGQRRNGSIPRKYWFQDGAPAHRSIIVRNQLHVLFPQRVVSLGHAQEWPPRSPDLTPLDYFMWGYLKERVYATVPRDVRDLQQRIRREVTAMQRTRMVRRAMESMMDRAHRCIAAQGLQIK